jgi:hypothetical protein
MDQIFDDNIDNILKKVELLFSEKILPTITKTIEDQKREITKDILVQAENSFVKKINGEDLSSKEETKIDEPYFISVYEDEKRRAYYDYKINPKYTDYDYVDLKKMTNEIFSRIKNDKQFEIVEKIRTQPYHKDWNHWKDHYVYAEKLFEFIERIHEGEYLVFTYIECTNYGTEKIILFTSFGSIYNMCYGRSIVFDIFHNDNLIPKPILDMFIYNVIHGNEYPQDIIYNDVKNFKQSIIIFQKWWQSRPVAGYTAELLKQENEKLKEEHQKIKHMYETLELKDQYHKAVELLKQNKKEREALDQDRREFYIEIEEKTKRYRQIQDIDTEITRLALIKQKLEKDRKDFEEEKAKFEEIRNSLM